MNGSEIVREKMGGKYGEFLNVFCGVPHIAITIDKRVSIPIRTGSISRLSESR